VFSYRVDYHALRHTFASLLANVGVSELVRLKLARHSEWKQTDRYTDSPAVRSAIALATAEARMAKAGSARRSFSGKKAKAAASGGLEG
jgi:integrase